MITRKKILFLYGFSALLTLSGFLLIFNSTRPFNHFDGKRAYDHVLNQTAFGARIPGSDAHAQTRAYIRTTLEKAGWTVEEQEFESFGHRGYNIVARRSEDSPGRILLGAHYDSRIQADHDPDVDKRDQAVSGANDGASGVAVLLELGRTIPPEVDDVWLVFFDLEDNGRLPTWDWILGSRAFVNGYALNDTEAVIILDMIGDANLNIYLEKNSDPDIRASIWRQAKRLGYEEYFINEEKFAMLDDHTPFLEAGIPAVDVIDFDYPYWHTSEDTDDKVSAQSLEIVGETILTWLRNRP